MKAPIAGCVLLQAAAVVAQAQAPPLRLQQTIPLAGVEGRIDHLAADLRQQRLFVAALGNNTLEVLDLRTARRIHTITGLSEPQGVFYLPASDRLFVANGSDGTCRIYDAASWRLIKNVALGDDADNLRYDAASRRVYVGYGRGALAALDEDGNVLARIPLDAHPESFQLEKGGPRIFVNLPDSRKIAVVDRVKGAVTAAWETAGALANFPMALDEPDHRLFVVCRRPAVLLVLNTHTGALVTKIATVGDCDDVFFNSSRGEIYATGGEGAISVIRRSDADHYSEVARIPTVNGARTSLFVPDLGKLFVAARRQGSAAAAVLVYERVP